MIETCAKQIKREPNYRFIQSFFTFKKEINLNLKIFFINKNKHFILLLLIVALREPILHILGERGQSIEHLITTLAYARLHFSTILLLGHIAAHARFVLDFVRTGHCASLKSILYVLDLFLHELVRFHGWYRACFEATAQLGL